MNLELPYSVVDVFAERPFAGNQLAVFRDAGQLTAVQMQLIAREMNYSETTFLLSPVPRNGGFDVRIFTPEQEVPFAGHPSLGTAFVIRETVIDPARRAGLAELTLHLPVGAIPITWRRPPTGQERLWMRQRPPAFFPPITAVAPIAELLGLTVADLDARFPVQPVTTGLPFVLVPLRDLAAVRRCRLRPDLQRTALAGCPAQMVLVFAPECYEPGHQLNARMFAYEYGVPEDPATGSANGCLAAYLVEHRYFGKDEVSLTVEQGYEIARPSVLHLAARRTVDGIEVDVGGEVHLIAEGRLRCPEVRG